MARHLAGISIAVVAASTILCSCANPTTAANAPPPTPTPAKAPAVAKVEGPAALSSVEPSDTPTYATTANGLGIDWNAPIFQGLTSSVESAVHDGGLSFTPAVPTLVGELAGVQVTDPAVVPAGLRGVALVFNFPIGADYPEDGRLVVQEREELKLSSADLASIAANPPGPHSNFSLTTIAGTDEPALLISSGTGYGRLIFIFKGINFDITGPYVTIESVTAAAAAVYKAAGG